MRLDMRHLDINSKSLLVLYRLSGTYHNTEQKSVRHCLTDDHAHDLQSRMYIPVASS